jgi:hypothetical protein
MDRHEQRPHKRPTSSFTLIAPPANNVNRIAPGQLCLAGLKQDTQRRTGRMTTPSRIMSRSSQITPPMRQRPNLGRRRSLTRCLDLRWDDDAFCGCEPREIVRAGEPVRAGLNGVSGLLQELPDVADAPVDRLGPDGEQCRDGDLRQVQALVQDGGQKPVGEGEAGAAAGAGSGQAGAVAAAFVQAGFPLLVMQRQQRGDQGCQSWAGRPVSAGWASQARPGLGWSKGSGTPAAWLYSCG